MNTVLATVDLSNREFMLLANEQTEELSRSMRSFLTPIYSDSERENKRIRKVALALAMECVGIPDMVGVLADYMEDVGKDEIAAEIRHNLSWLDRVKLLCLGGSSSRSYYGGLIRTIERQSSYLSSDRTYQYSVVGYPLGTYVGIPDESELPGYPYFQSEERKAVCQPSMVGSYQATFSHVRRLLVAALNGWKVSPDVANVAGQVHEIVHQELTLDKRIPWVSRLKTMGGP